MATAFSKAVACPLFILQVSRMIRISVSVSLAMSVLVLMPKSNRGALNLMLIPLRFIHMTSGVSNDFGATTEFGLTTEGAMTRLFFLGICGLGVTNESFKLLESLSFLLCVGLSLLRGFEGVVGGDNCRARVEGFVASARLLLSRVPGRTVSTLARLPVRELRVPSSAKNAVSGPGVRGDDASGFIRLFLRLLALVGGWVSSAVSLFELRMPSTGFGLTWLGSWSAMDC